MVFVRKHTFDESFFENIDSEEKSYWLGFMSADGGISKNRLSLNLHFQDKAHVEKWAAAINSTYPFYDVKEHERGAPQTKLSVYSKKLIEDLNRLGVTERKTFSLKPWKSDCRELQRHYWRGFFDGDGGLSFLSSGAWAFAITSASVPILEAFCLFVEHETGVILRITKDKSVFRVRCGGLKKVQVIMSLLYHDATIFLDRKMDLYKSLMAITPKFKQVRRDNQNSVCRRSAC